MRLASSPARVAAVALLLSGLATGCAATRSPPAVDYTATPAAVVAEYRSESRPTTIHGGRPDSNQWKVWRDADRQVREYPDSHTADYWQLDGTTLFHTKYFHAERRGIEFQQIDLAMVGALPDWQQIALLISPALLAKLPVKSSGVRDAVPWVRHAGTHNSVRWDVTLRTDLMLPTKVIRRTDAMEERLTLLSATPLAQSDWTPEPVAGYIVMDFADLGDNERDPFVLRVQHQLGLAHGHAH